MDTLTFQIGMVWLFCYLLAWPIKSLVGFGSGDMKDLFLSLGMGTVLSAAGFLLFFGYDQLFIKLDQIRLDWIPLLVLFSGIWFFSFPLSNFLRWPSGNVPLDQFFLAVGLMIMSFGITLGGQYLIHHFTQHLLLLWAIASFMVSTLIHFAVWNPK